MTGNERTFFELGKTIMYMINGFKEADLAWKEDNSERLEYYQAQKRKRDSKFENEFKIFKSNLEREAELIEMYNKKIIKDYQGFLESLDDLIMRLEQSYPQLHKSMILIIHRYASDLLNSIYAPVKNDYLLKDYDTIIDLLTEMTYDTADLNGESKPRLLLPERTLKFIRENKKPNRLG